MKTLVIDVNVFIAAVQQRAAQHEECVAFLRRVHAVDARDGVRVRVPPLFVLEFFAVFNRRVDEEDSAQYPELQADDDVGQLRTIIEPFTEDDAHEIMTAVATAFPVQAERGQKRHPFVKGGDLEFLAVARKHGCALVTTDDGLLEYGRRGFAKVIRPSAWTPEC